MRIGRIATTGLATWWAIVTAGVAGPPQQPVVDPPGRRLATFAAGDGDESTHLPIADRRDVQLYRSALRQLEDRRYDEAVGLLQAVLDGDADGFIEEPGNLPQPVGRRLVRLREAAVRAIEELPDEARRVYRQRYEPAARGALDDAVASGDVDRLAATARRFPATESGREASWRLAQTSFDRGETYSAVARLEALRSDVPPERKPVLLWKLAACYSRLGDDQRRDAVLAKLESTGATVPFDDGAVASNAKRRLREFLPVAERNEHETRDWPVFQGDPARTGFRQRADGDVIDWSANSLTDPFLPPGTEDSPLQRHLARWSAQTALLQYSNGRPAAPAARPVVLGETLFFRTTADLVAVDAATGTYRWRSVVDPLCRQYLSGDTPATPEGDVAARTFVGQRLWSDKTWATLSAGRRYVFSIEETGAATALPALPDGDVATMSQQPVLPSPFNRLVVCDASTGRRIAEAGGSPTEATAPTGAIPLAGTFFYGAPVPFGGRWYVLGEVDGETFLHCLNVDRRIDVCWSLPVAEHADTIDRNAARRTAGYSPCVCGGLLICPVGDDLVVAVDPGMRSLRWAFRMPDETGQDTRRRNMLFHGTPEPLDIAALDHCIVLVQPQGLVAAVELFDGATVWESREFVCHWPIGVDSERIYLQTPTGVAALRIVDGTPAWPAPTILGSPSGRGVVISDRVYVPLADATLAVLDATSGKPLATRPVPFHQPLGNLIVVGGSLVSQSATRVVAVPVDDP